MLRKKEKLKNKNGKKISRWSDGREQKENNTMLNKGITLIALVITIIVILILARSKY